MRTFGLALGTRFGRLVVVRRAESAPDGKSLWECVCDCGNTVTVRRASLVGNTTRSCGCLQRDTAGEQLSRILTKHGHCGTRTYVIWKAMTARCTNPNNKDWRLYGGRGIRVCESWRTFENFLTDMGECPDGLSIDRYPDMNGNYEPGNCRWANPKEQSDNTRRNRRITFNGETLTLADWARRLGITPATLHGRLARNSVERALSMEKRS